MQANQIHILDTRPEFAQGMIIFNAPRPLYGHNLWLGKCVCGIFYAAVNPGGEHAEFYICENILLGAYVCKYITFDDMRTWVRQFCADNDYDMSELDDNDIRQSYFSEHDTERIEL